MRLLQASTGRVRNRLMHYVFCLVFYYKERCHARLALSEYPTAFRLLHRMHYGSKHEAVTA